MKFEQFLLNENMVDKALTLVKRMDFKKAKKFLLDQFEQFMVAVEAAGVEREAVSIINKGFNTRYRSLEQIKRDRLRESELNEDAAHWWKLIKTEAFPTLAFYPALTVWLELDNLLRGQDVNMRVVIVYSLFWVLLVSGKYLKGWTDWKKQNPEEYNAEKAQGKGGVI
jgi:hypothetical protein